MKNKRILITGGAGLIGSHIAERLLARGDRVLVIDNFSTGRRDNLQPADSLTLVEGTIADDAQPPRERVCAGQTVFSGSDRRRPTTTETPRDRSTSTFERQPHAAFSRAEIRYRPMSGWGCGQNMVAGSTRRMD